MAEPGGIKIEHLQSEGSATVISGLINKRNIPLSSTTVVILNKI